MQMSENLVPKKAKSCTWNHLFRGNLRAKFIFWPCTHVKNWQLFVW